MLNDKSKLVHNVLNPFMDKEARFEISKRITSKNKSSSNNIEEFTIKEFLWIISPNKKKIHNKS